MIEEGYTAPARGGRGGRPTKKTAKRCRAILAGIEAGWPYVVACRCAGVSYDVFKLWCKTDERFREQVAFAEAEAIKANLETIKAASRDNWPAAAWLLERRHPEMFSKPEVQLSLAVQQNLNTAEGSNSLELVVIKDLEFLALQKHPDYTHHPDRSPAREIETELSGTLTKKGVNGQIISQSEAKALETQAESVNQRVRQMFSISKANLQVIVRDLRAERTGSVELISAIQSQISNALPERKALHSRYTLTVDVIEDRSFFTMGNWNASTRLKWRVQQGKGSILREGVSVGEGHRSNMAGYITAGAVSQDAFNVAMADLMSSLSAVPTS